MKCILCVAIVLALLPSAHGAERTFEVDAYLRRRFPSKEGVVRYEKGLSTIEPLEAPVLRRLLPATVFYRAKLREFLCWAPEAIGALVAATKTGVGNTYKACLPPTFDDGDPAFLALFAGVRADSPADRRELARAITQLFASITYAGRIGAVRQRSFSVEVELWHGHLMWRRVRISFTTAHTVKRVELINPVASHRSW